MKRYYGVIKDIDSANKFVNDLYEAASINTDNPIKLLSSYSEANATGFTKAFDYLYQIGFVNTGLSTDALELVMETATRTLYGIPAMSATAQLSDNLMIIAQGGYSNSADPPETCPIEQNLANIIIRHTTTREVEGETEKHSTMTYLRQVNDNGVASAVAYEITQVKSGDLLVKVAACAPDVYIDEINERAFVGLSINCYKQWDNSMIVSERGHSGGYFQASGQYGGFVLHKMKEPSSEWGITVFTSKGSPLFTWTPSGDALDEVSSNAMVNMNAVLNRTVGPDPEDTEDEESPIIMAALAPIFGPASNLISATAKWLQQTPHNYSYFDKTGHILIRSVNGDYKFFVDHGICLSDEVDGSTDGSTIPGIRPINYATSDRPDIPDAMPYSTNMISYFDSLAGLSARGWMNFKDTSGQTDMAFSGSPIILSDGACRFINRASSPQYGKFAAHFYGSDGGYSGASANSSILYFVARFPGRSVDATGDTFCFPVLSICPTSANRQTIDTEINLLAFLTTNGSGSYSKYPTSYASFKRGYGPGHQNMTLGISRIFRNYAAYALYCGPNVNSIYLRCRYYDSAGTLQTAGWQVTGYDSAAFGPGDGTPLIEGSVVLGGVYVDGDSTTTPPNGNAWEWSNTWPNTGGVDAAHYPSDGGEACADVKFIAIGDLGNSDGKLGYFANNNTIIDECLQYLCERYNCTVQSSIVPYSEWFITDENNKSASWGDCASYRPWLDTYVDIAHVYGSSFRGACRIARISVPSGASVTIARSGSQYIVTASSTAVAGIIRYTYSDNYTTDVDGKWNVASSNWQINSGTQIISVGADTMQVLPGATARYEIVD